jgi:hypothetical protein
LLQQDHQYMTIRLRFDGSATPSIANLPGLWLAASCRDLWLLEQEEVLCHALHYEEWAWHIPAKPVAEDHRDH